MSEPLKPAPRRFRVVVVLEQEYGPSEWVQKIGRPITIIEEDGTETPEKALETIATALEIKLGEMNDE